MLVHSAMAHLVMCRFYYSRFYRKNPTNSLRKFFLVLFWVALEPWVESGTCKGLAASTFQRGRQFCKTHCIYQTCRICCICLVGQSMHLWILSSGLWTLLSNRNCPKISAQFPPYQNHVTFRVMAQFFSGVSKWLNCFCDVRCAAKSQWEGIRTVYANAEAYRIELQ